MTTPDDRDRQIREFAALTNAPPALREIMMALAQVRDAPALLDWLDEYFARPFALQAMGVWQAPRILANPEAHWVLDENLFLHKRLPSDYWSDFLDNYRAYGVPVTTENQEFRIMPFTFAEAEDEAKERGLNNTWVFDLYRRHGFEDGLYCPMRPYTAVFGARAKTSLPGPARSFVHLGAMLAAEWLERRIVKQQRKKYELTPREREALQAYLSDGDRESAAARLGIGVKYFDDLLDSARKKFGVKNSLQAVGAALALRLIKY